MTSRRGCDRFEREGLLRLERGEGLDEHTETCPECMAALIFYTEMKNTICVARRPVRPRPGWEQRVLENIGKQDVRETASRWHVFAAVTALSVVLCVTMHFWNESKGRHGDGRIVIPRLERLEIPIPGPLAEIAEGQAEREADSSPAATPPASTNTPGTEAAPTPTPPPRRATTKRPAQDPCAGKTGSMLTSCRRNKIAGASQKGQSIFDKPLSLD